MLLKGGINTGKGKILAITLPDEMYDQLKAMAEKKGQSAAAIVRLALAEYCEKENARK